MLQIYPVMFWPFFKTPIMSNPSKYGVKIIPDQCEYTIHCIGNFVSESETVTRQEFVDYYDKLKKKIDDVYKKIASRFTEKEARKHWLNGSFNMISTWGRHLSKYRYMQIYFTAKDKGSVDVLYDGAYPIRTFNVLSYKNNQLYLEESDILLDELDSRILELCNGNNTVDEISLRLLYSVHEIRERLVSLEDKMLIYGSVL